MISAADQQLGEAYLAELAAMALILFIGLFWLCSLIADYLVARRAEQQLRNEQLAQRGFKAWKRLGKPPAEDLQ